MSDQQGTADFLGEQPISTTHPARWRWAIAVLTAIYMLNFLDRQIINILAESIKRDLDLSDAQLGLLTGVGFAVIYAVVGIPIGRLTDRHNRPRILAASLAIWSGLTALCGVVHGFTALLLCRLGIGAAESATTPAAHGLIVEYTSRDKRARAIAIFQIGGPLGSLLGMAIGGIIAGAFGWRTAFYVAGIPGLVVALVAIVSLFEPRKPIAKRAEVSGDFVQAAGMLLRKKAFVLMILGCSLVTMRVYGTQAFIASFFFRNHAAELTAVGDSVGQLLGVQMGLTAVVGVGLGVLGGVVSIIGTIAGGYAADFLARSDVRNYAAAAAIPQLIAVPLLILGLVWPHAMGSLLLLTLPTLFTAMTHAPFYSGIQALATPSNRGTAAALANLSLTVIGLGLGPVLVGLLSDWLAASGLSSGEGLRWALVVAETPALFGAALLLWSRRYAVEEMEEGTHASARI
jgi:MFS family permease